MLLSIKKLLAAVLLLFVCNHAMASHIVGGDVTYFYIGDTTISGVVTHHYKVYLSIYEDCINGQPEAITQDNPAFLSLYDGAYPNHLLQADTNIYYSSSDLIPAVSAPSPCGGLPNPFPTCLVKKTFIKDYYLHPNTTGYICSYQRCCRNGAIANILDPGDNGATYFCNIPADPILNNSAVFKNYPPQIICYNLPLVYDNSATDADGDSLSYGFTGAILGANDADIKPIPGPPPYDSVTYIYPYSSQVPFTGSSPITIDPVTGIITGTPNLKGRYLVTVSCHEWRNGVMINTISREYQFIVNDCRSLYYVPGTSEDTTILTGDSVQFVASGGYDYYWTPGLYLSDPSIGNPVGHFPVAGNFVYTLHATSDSGCTGTNTRTVHVLNHAMYRAPNAFTPNGDNLNDYLKPMPVLNAQLISFKVFNRNGNVVYVGGASDRGWDGTYKGKPQNMDTYFWEITYLDNNGVTRTERGNVTLVR